jgi:hypothetical protein
VTRWWLCEARSNSASLSYVCGVDGENIREEVEPEKKTATDE